MTPKIIKTLLIKTVRISISFIRYLAVFVAAFAPPAVLSGADLIGKFTALVLMLALLFAMGNYGKSALFQLCFRLITDLSPVLSSDVVSTS